MITAASVAVEAAIKAKSREQCLRTTLADAHYEPEETERLMFVCRRRIPEKVYYIDGVVLVSIVSRIGLIDLLEYNKDLHIDFYENGYHVRGFSFKTDDNGRIIELKICDETFRYPPFDLPAGVVCLDKLADIYVSNCRSLPIKELSSLPHLQNICFDNCLNLLENFPVQMELKHLKKLAFGGYGIHPLSPFFT